MARAKNARGEGNHWNFLPLFHHQDHLGTGAIGIELLYRYHPLNCGEGQGKLLTLQGKQQNWLGRFNGPGAQRSL
jgi:hypothetical protein